MRFHIKELSIDFQSDDESRAIFYYHGCSDLDQEQWAFSGSLGKS